MAKGAQESCAADWHATGVDRGVIGLYCALRS